MRWNSNASRSPWYSWAGAAAVLYLQVASDDVLKDVRKTPAALRQAIERLQTSPSLFADFSVCARTKP